MFSALFPASRDFVQNLSLLLSLSRSPFLSLSHTHTHPPTNTAAATVGASCTPSPRSSGELSHRRSSSSSRISISPSTTLSCSTARRARHSSRNSRDARGLYFLAIKMYPTTRGYRVAVEELIQSCLFSFKDVVSSCNLRLHLRIVSGLD